jgi:GTP-binding protein
LFTSATEGYALNALMRAAHEVYQSGSTQLSTGVLNRQVQHLIDRNPPANKQGKRFKVYYSLQTETHPITLRLFCNQVTYLDAAYKRYLLSGLMELFKLKGCPLKLVFVGKPKPVVSSPAGHNASKPTRRHSNAQGARTHKVARRGKK